MDADAILAEAFRRWQNIEAAKKIAADDSKDLFAELKAQGFDNTKAVRAAFRRKVDSEDAQKVAKDEEFEGLVEIYLTSLARDAREGRIAA